MNIAETHPLANLPNVTMVETPKFDRYATTFVTTSINVARALAERQYLEITSEGNNASFVRCKAGALRGAITVVAGNSITVELPHEALLLVEIWGELAIASSLIPVRELQNCHWVFDNGKVLVEERPDHQWYFEATEVRTGPIPNPNAPSFRIAFHVLQDNSEERLLEQIRVSTQSAVQHVSLMLPEERKLAFESECLAEVLAQSETLLALCRISRTPTVEQTIRQIVLGCAARHAKI